MSDNKFGVKLADGTFIKGNLGYNNKVDPPSVMITMSNTEAVNHLADLMSTSKTSNMKYYLDYLAGEYINCVFKSMVADPNTGNYPEMVGMVNVFFKGYIKKGETNNGQESNEGGADSGEEGSD